MTLTDMYVVSYHMLIISYNVEARGMKSISTLKMYRVLLIFVERTQCGVFEDLIIFFCNGMSLMIPSYSSPAPTI